MQPTYLPWLGYFDLLDHCDVFVILDTVQLTRRSWQVRNRVKGRNGNEVMLSIPVLKTRHRDELSIDQAEVDDSTDWRGQHVRKLRESYSDAPQGQAILASTQAGIERPTRLLSEITTGLIRDFAATMGIRTEIIRSGEVGEFPTHRDALLLDICRAVGADRYLSARGSAQYIEMTYESGAFRDSGVSIEYQNYEHPEYPQQGSEFLPFMGIVDLLANVEPARALEVVRAGRRTPLSSQDVRP